MNRQETYENLCVLLEEYAEADVETVAEQILGLLGLMGEDLLESLDPPSGLQTWLRSHGLSLVTITEARSPRVWDALEAEEAAETPENGLEEGPGESPLLQVGDYVDYRTAPSGPHSQSQIGSGTIKSIGGETVEIEFSPGGAGIIIFPAMDFIRQVTPAPAPERSDQAPPS